MTHRFSKKITFTILVIGLIVLNILAFSFFKRFDLTQDQRYTLSDKTLEIVQQIDEPLYIDVLLEGNFPAEFRKLQDETKQLLEEFSAQNNYIYFTFTNPLDTKENPEKIMASLHANGIQPLTVNVNDKGKQTQEIAFPWAIAEYKGKQVKIPLIKNMMGAKIEDKINVSVQHLEYSITEALQNLSIEKTKKIAVIKGIGEPNDIYVADFLLSLRENYYIAPFTLDSIASNPEKALSDLNNFDLALIIKPTETFSDEKIQILDQYTMHGGKTIWMIDEVMADMDSLYTNNSLMAFPKESGLGPMLFKYGVRINPVLIKDEYGTPIKIAVGKQGTQTVFEEYIWKYAPFAVAQTSHAITKNIDGVKFEFANSIDTLKNGIKKTILLQSSPFSYAVGTPREISLAELNEQTDPQKLENEKGNIPLAVLLEGSFTSVYKNRTLPWRQKNYITESKPTQMLVISDGDIAKNQLDQEGRPLETGFDKWTNHLFGNKEFLMNSINYLLDDNGLIQLRTKDVKLPLLNKELVYSDYQKIQRLAFGLPLLLLGIFTFCYLLLRKKRFKK